MTKPKGVFCLEGSWALDGDLTDRFSVEQQLRMFESAEVCEVIHRDVATQDEFKYYLVEWLKKKYARYPLAYFAFHGARGNLTIGKTILTLETLATMIGPQGASDRILYFGSCSTMAVAEDKLKGFCRATGAKAIVGYTRRIDWLESAAFDCLLVPKLIEPTRIRPIFTSLEKDHPGFVRRLGLRIATSTWATPRSIAAVVAPDAGVDKVEASKGE
jgi:hypothetical protein